MTYKLAVTLTNETEGHTFADFTEDLEQGWTLTDEGAPDFGQIYRLAQREYGRCQSSVYVDKADGRVERVGWFFVRRDQYDRGEGSYLRGAWVSVVEVRPEVRTLVAVG